MNRMMTLILGCSMLACLPAEANCKPMPDKWELVDLGDIGEGVSELEAIAIDESGRTIISGLTAGFGGERIEKLREPNGRLVALKQAEDDAVRRTIQFAGKQARLVAYTRYKDGYVPLELTTLIDRKGRETDVRDYCPAPLSDAALTHFAISPSAKHMAAAYKDEDGYTVGRCSEEKAFTPLFTSPDEVSITSLNDQGHLAGITTQTTGDKAWRALKNSVETFSPPEEALYFTSASLDGKGNLYLMSSGAVKNAFYSVDLQGRLNQVEPLEGGGWDIEQALVSACGSIAGFGFQTDFESFLQLPDEEQQAIRDNMQEYMGLAAERRFEQFIWHPESGGYPLTDALEGATGWQGMSFNAINERHEIVGRGTNPHGESRAILLKPKK